MLVSFLLILTFCSSVNFVKAAAYNDKGVKLDVEANKSWTIRFNKELDSSTIDESKFIVTDESGQQVGVNVSIGNDKKSVIVSPKSEYSYGKTYNLYIKEGLKSTDENSLITPAKMQFTVKNSSASDFNKAYTVCLDAGHGGDDAGNVGQTGLKEKDIDLSVALKVGKILQDSGVNVVYTRNTDSISWSKDNDLKSRFDIANNSKSDFFVSIHCNAYPDNPSTSGIETYYSDSDDVGKNLAQAVQDGLVNNTGLINRGIKVGLAQHEILRGTAASAILVELGFITNPQESVTLGTDDFQNKSASAIANGIIKSLKLVDKSKNITISSIQDLSASVTQGASYALPLAVTASMSDGSSKKVNVIWNSNVADTSSTGTYTYQGSVGGYSNPVKLLLTIVDTDNSANSNGANSNGTNNDVICIDPGHGMGSDTGASGINNLQEDDVTLAVGLKLGKILENQGVKVVYTRTGDMRSTPMSVVDSLQKRCDISNNANAEYFVALHCNAADPASANGTETWDNDGNPISKNLATNVQNNIVQEVGMYDRGLKDGYGRGLYVIKNTNAPAILIELGFLTNPSDAQKLSDDSYQQKFAQAIADGILQSLGNK